MDIYTIKKKKYLMKKMILLSVRCAVLFIAVSCGQANETAESALVENETQAVQAVDIEEEMEGKIVEEMVIPQKSAEPQAEEQVVLPSKSADAKPANPTPAESTKPTSESKAEVIKDAKPVNEQTKPKGSTSTRVPSLPMKKDEFVKKESKTAATPSHSAWNTILAANVSTTGGVNYAAIKRSEKALDSYLELLANNSVQNSWSSNEKKAYWINLYNASTVKLIVANYPTKSIQNLEDGKPWDKRWIESGGKTYTLNEIENSILRPQFKDARIHFAVNCAAQSCPRLMNKAFTADNLESLLEQNAKWFINSKFNNITTNKIKVSKVFNWYADDFGNLIDFLNKYSKTKISDDAQVDYLEYDWKLNGK
jgi:outer membrane biosynthesis protein TonB